MKDKLWNQLNQHLDKIVPMFAQEFFIQENFPYQDAITNWKDEKVQVETTM
jgi:predicted SpoU family rRNA methylase